MTKVMLIGDCHGLFGSYLKMIEKIDYPSIQLGDFGLGFDKEIDNLVIERLKTLPQHRFIRGNHDNPAICKTSSNFIEDGTVINDVMFIGGAWSIDYAWRTEGKTWWRDEELSYSELQELVDIYKYVKPRVMITHDCPSSVSLKMFIETGQSLGGSVQYKTRTGEAFQTMLDYWEPQEWYFGHWHKTKTQQIGRTKFVCLNELDHMDVEL